MTKLTRNDVLKLAALCRLRLSDDEIGKLQTELSEIISYMQILDSVDLTGLIPTYQVSGLKNIYRADEVRDYGYETADLLSNAPAVLDGQFKVKRVL